MSRPPVARQCRWVRTRQSWARTPLPHCAATNVPSAFLVSGSLACFRVQSMSRREYKECRWKSAAIVAKLVNRDEAQCMVADTPDCRSCCANTGLDGRPARPMMWYTNKTLAEVIGSQERLPRRARRGWIIVGLIMVAMALVILLMWGLHGPMRPVLLNCYALQISPWR